MYKLDFTHVLYLLELKSKELLHAIIASLTYSTL